MGLDGFSMGNLGLNTEMTSAQMANQAEQIAKKESEIIIKDVTESANGTGVKRKKEQSEKDQHFNDGLDDKKGDAEEDENQSGLSEKDFEDRNPKEFSVRINPETQMVELLNNSDGKILEIMNPEDLMGLAAKLDNASGILVNRKI